MQQAPHQSCLCRERNCRILHLNRMGKGLFRGRSAAPNSSLSARVEVKRAGTPLVPLPQGHIFRQHFLLPWETDRRPLVQVTWCHLSVALLTSRVPEKRPSLCCSGFWPGGAIHTLTLLFAIHLSVSGQ